MRGRGWDLERRGAVYIGFQQWGSWVGALGGGSHDDIEENMGMGLMVRALRAWQCRVLSMNARICTRKRRFTF